MATWVLGCINCKNEFIHTKIDDYKLLDFLDPLKPKIPEEGVEVRCPYCGQNRKYKRSHLMYRP